MNKWIFFFVSLTTCACSETVLEGPSGPAGEPGARGPAGPPGETIAHSYVREAAYLVDVFGGANVLCDEGDIVLGGGCKWGKSPDVRALPYLDAPMMDEKGGDVPAGWTCVGESTQATEVTAFVVCGVSP